MSSGLVRSDAVDKGVEALHIGQVVCLGACNADVLLLGTDRKAEEALWLGADQLQHGVISSYILHLVFARCMQLSHIPLSVLAH